jgi:hypothetical protein
MGAETKSDVNSILLMIDYMLPEVETVDVVSSYFLKACRMLLREKARDLEYCPCCGSRIQKTDSEE